MVDTFSAICIKKRYPFLNSSDSGSDSDTFDLTVTVTDDQGNPVEGASVTYDNG